jgi:uncharacterized membrane protein
MIQVLIPVALLANGIAAGVMLGNAIGPAALALELPYDRYVDMIKYLWPKYDPFVPILNALALALDAIIAIIVPRSQASDGVPVLFSLAAALLTILVVISLTKNVPINKYVTGLDPVTQPEDWPDRDPRSTWKKWNQIRVALALMALGAGLAGAAILL